LHVLLFEPRQFGGDLDFLIGFRHIHARHERGRTGIGKGWKSAGEIVEQRIDLALQGNKWIRARTVASNGDERFQVHAYLHSCQ